MLRNTSNTDKILMITYFIKVSISVNENIQTLFTKGKSIERVGKYNPN